MGSGKSKYDDRPICLARGPKTPIENACQNHYPCPIHCGAVCKRDKRLYGTIRFCSGIKVTNMPRCQMHGGKSLRGMASPKIKAGFHSKHLVPGGQLLDWYEESQSHPRLVRVRDQMALLAVRELELTERLNNKESLPIPRGKAVDALADYEAALRGEDEKLKEEKFNVLRELIRSGNPPAEDYEVTWAEIREIMQEKGKLALVENKLLETSNNFIEVAAVLGMWLGLRDVVWKLELDGKSKMAIEDYIRKIIGMKVRETAPRRQMIEVQPIIEGKLDDKQKEENG